MRYLAAYIFVNAVLTTACNSSSPDTKAPLEPGSITANSAALPAKYTIEQLLDSVNYRGLSFSRDNSKLLTSSNKTGIFNVYTIPVDGGAPVMLTRSTTESIYALTYFPNDERILYTADKGGNELNHIYLRKLDGTVQDLTPGEKLKANFVDWSADKASFFITTNERDPRYFDLYEYNQHDYSRTMLYKNNSGYQIGPVSADRRFIALRKTLDNANADIYIYDRRRKETTLLTTAEGDIDNNPMTFSPSGHSLYYTTDNDYEFQYLVRHDLDTQSNKTVLKLDGDILYRNGNKSVRFSSEGSRLIVTSNQNARVVVNIYNSKTMQRLGGSNMPDSSVAAATLSNNGGTLAMIVSNGKIPSDIYLQSASSDAPQRLLSSLNSEVNSKYLVAGKVVRFTSYDGVSVPGILYRPHQAATNKLPALVWVHGGPGGESRIGYNALIQYLVNNGYVIYAINNRGSSGSGKTFYHLDDHNHGQGDLEDVIASKQMLIETGYVNPDKIGIIGASYGGYMVLAALAFKPTSFQVGVDIFGVANWARTLASVPSWWESQNAFFAAELGDHNTEQDYLNRISPYFYAKNIVRPLIVLQGANDPRVLQIESEEIVEKVRSNNVPVEYILFPDEGHGFRKNSNRITAYNSIRRFLDKYLRDSGVFTPTTQRI